MLHNSGRLTKPHDRRQGAYRIVFAILQTHACVEQLDLIRLGASVLWRIHHARAPPTQLLHSQLAYEAKVDVDTSAGSASTTVSTLDGNSRDSHEDGIRADDGDDGAGDSDCGGDDVLGPAAGLKGRALSTEDETPGPIPQVKMRYAGHAEWITTCPAHVEGLSASSSPGVHAQLIVKSITREAERLMVPNLGRLASGTTEDGGQPVSSNQWHSYPLAHGSSAAMLLLALTAHVPCLPWPEEGSFSWLRPHSTSSPHRFAFLA